jgi:hypothetical protein
MRVAYIGAGAKISGSSNYKPVPSGFYERARAAGFNYALVEFYLGGSEWIDGRYDSIHYSNSGLRKQLKDEFVAADKKGLKLIPLFQTSDIHSNHWNRVNNDSIGWQKLPEGFPKWACDSVLRKVPTFAPDPQGVFGFDSSFNQLLNVIYRAFNDAKSSPGFSYADLDYIHFGADEPIFVLDTPGVWKVIVMAGLCKNDRDWLKKNGYGNAGTQNQIIALLGSNIKRKVQMIAAAGRRYGHKTKALYYGDMLDPNHLGGAQPGLCSFVNIFDSVSTNTVTIKTSGLASNSYVQAVRDLSYVVQWNYERYYHDTDYNTDSTFSYFRRNNLKFLHGNALADDNSPISATRLHQFMEQATVSTYPKFNNSVMGFVSFHWCSGSDYFHGIDLYNQVPSYKTLEFLSHILWHNAALFE